MNEKKNPVFRKEIKYIKKNKIEILELKNTMTSINNSMNGPNRRKEVIGKKDQLT